MGKFRWRFVGLFDGLPAVGSAGALILPANERRRAAQLYQYGATGAVYLKEQASEIGTRTGFPLGPGDALALGTAPFAPHNELYAVGAAGHALYIWELVEE
jgi:hypothetical protein